MKTFSVILKALLGIFLLLCALVCFLNPDNMIFGMPIIFNHPEMLAKSAYVYTACGVMMLGYAVVSAHLD